MYKKTQKKFTYSLIASLGLWSLSASATTATETMQLAAGKSLVFSLPNDVVRVAVGSAEVADVQLISPREVYLLGKKVGTTNVMVWTKESTKVIDLKIGLDVQTLRSSMRELVPNELNVRVDALGDTLVVSGVVSDPMRLQRLMSLAEVFSGGKKVINLMHLEGSQQVMLEVKVAEVSKTLLDKLGFQVTGNATGSGTNYNILSSLLVGVASKFSVARTGASITLDAEINNGLVKILAEPTITAISGQEGSFLAGGKIFIPVPQSSSSGATTITLEEREFGVGLKFTPTVLEDGLINLLVTPEVSELSQAGTAVTTSTGQVSILPSISTRRASTTVQLRDGETFAIGGLINNNVTEAVKAFPGLGELPVLGAFFRSTAYQTERTELVFVVTPHLAKPRAQAMPLPTDVFIEPTRSELIWQGQLEGGRSISEQQR